ncbi:MAG: exopolyphosphatase [Nitriliruptorales bacterium]
MTDGSRRAAVDVGSNTVRLLVVDADGSTLAREMEITRLGRGVDERGRLDDGSLVRTLEVLARYRGTWEELGVAGDAVRIAATSAVRDAADRERFFAGVRERTGGIEAEVLSGDEEAATTFRGVAAALDVPRPTLLLDVGGGSTELVVGDGEGNLAAAVSLQLGSVRLTERCVPSDPPSTAELGAAREEAAARCEEGAAHLAAAGADPDSCAALVGVAGTVTTLAALHLGLERYDPEPIHGARVPRDSVAAVLGDLAAMTSAERARLGPMAKGREDVIVAGVLIVAAVMDRFGFDALVASEADILDGLVQSIRGRARAKP